MIADIDTYRCAHLLIERYGDNAPIEAAMRADVLMEAGDMEGVAVWKGIRKAVEELLDKTPPGNQSAPH